MLREACREAATWPAVDGVHPHIAVNLSLQTLLDDRVHEAVRVALDDFGTGFSTLAWLQHLPADTIKVDRSLTVDTAIHGDQRRRRVANALLRGMVAVGDELGVDVLAEGVETARELEAVRAAGCRLVQGFLLGRPAPVQGLRYWLA